MNNIDMSKESESGEERREPHKIIFHGKEKLEK